MRLAVLHGSLARARRDAMTGTASVVMGVAPKGAVLRAIELRVEHIGSLFDAFDPFPIPSRDLSPAVEDFVVGWARDLPVDVPLRIVVHAPAAEAAGEAATHAPVAFARHFLSRAERMSGDIDELMRIGRISLVIGVAVLGACVLLLRVLSQAFPGDVSRFAQESLLILGWVANWRPIEIFLYDWWPLAQHRRLYRRLAAAPVMVEAVQT